MSSIPANEVTSYPELTGWSPTAWSKGARFRLGTTVLGPENAYWMYVKASADLAAGAIAVNTSTFAASAGTGWTIAGAAKTDEYGFAKKTAVAVA